MNAQRMTRVMLAGAVALALAALTVLIVALPATAGPSAQDGWTPIPTPTPYPVDDVGPYMLETVGGDDSPQVFPGQEVDGADFEETTVVSEYPEQMIFAVTVESETREIDSVSLTIHARNGTHWISTAEHNQDNERWTAALSTAPKELPAWTPLEFEWCAHDTADETVCTDPTSIVYWDPHQAWNRVTTDHAILYWYGFGEDNPEHVAREFTYAVESTHPRRADGFGWEMSYKPVVVIYPEAEDVQQVYSFYITGLFPDSRLGVTTLDFTPIDLPEMADTCIHYPPRDERTMAWRIKQTIDMTTVGMAFLVGADVLGQDVSALENADRGNYGQEYVNKGFVAWDNGQGVWFSRWAIPYDQRLRNLATLQDLPSLMEAGLDVQADGCSLLHADMGASFINWLVYTYGIETYRQIVDLMTLDFDPPRPIYDPEMKRIFLAAIEEATGKPFAELENEWRAYLELPPLE